MFVSSRAADPRIHDAAIRTARRCRHIIQAVLREEEWLDADREFYLVVREEMENLVDGPVRQTDRSQAPAASL